MDIKHFLNILDPVEYEYVNQISYIIDYKKYLKTVFYSQGYTLLTLKLRKYSSGRDGFNINKITGVKNKLSLDEYMNTLSIIDSQLYPLKILSTTKIIDLAFTKYLEKIFNKNYEEILKHFNEILDFFLIPKRFGVEIHNLLNIIRSNITIFFITDVMIWLNRVNRTRVFTVFKKFVKNYQHSTFSIKNDLIKQNAFYLDLADNFKIFSIYISNLDYQEIKKWVQSNTEINCLYGWYLNCHKDYNSEINNLIIKHYNPYLEFFKYQYIISDVQNDVLNIEMNLVEPPKLVIKI